MRDVIFLIPPPIIEHLGDWLIMNFPLTSWMFDEALIIEPKEPFVRNATDLYIQEIQMYKKVHSSRLHTLLCAICSAKEVSYQEQYDKYNNVYSGKFQGLLLDIFGENKVENEFFNVERDKVIKYKNKVTKKFNEIEKYIINL